MSMEQKERVVPKLIWLLLSAAVVIWVAFSGAGLRHAAAGAIVISDPVLAVGSAVSCGDTLPFGDVNGNGQVEPSDALWILRRVVELPLPEGGGGCSSHDVDCDGEAGAVDALKILRHVAGLPVGQHEPCPDIGTPAAR